MFLGIVGVIAAAFFLLRMDEPWSWRLTGAGAVAAGLGVIAAATWVLHRSPPMRRWCEAEETLAQRYPHTIVLLSPIREDQIPETFTAGWFGPEVSDLEKAACGHDASAGPVG